MIIIVVVIVIIVIVLPNSENVADDFTDGGTDFIDLTTDNTRSVTSNVGKYDADGTDDDDDDDDNCLIINFEHLIDVDIFLIIDDDIISLSNNYNNNN